MLPIAVTTPNNFFYIIPRPMTNNPKTTHLTELPPQALMGNFMANTHIIREPFDYTEWRKEYFENSYKGGEASQLDNFLNSATVHFPQNSFGVEG